MANVDISVKHKQRTDVLLNWELNNPILLKGEIGVENDTGKIKIGDGILDWNSLSYFPRYLANTQLIDGIKFDGSFSINHYGICSSSAGTVAKSVSIANFVLSIGSRALVKFSTTNTAINPTLNINNTGDKDAIYRGIRVTNVHPTFRAGYVYDIVYNGDSYDVINDMGYPNVATIDWITNPK